MIPNIYDLLSGDTTVDSLLGNADGIAVYRDEAPDKTPLPYCVYSVVTGQPANTLDSPPDMDEARVQFDVYALDSDTADACYRAIRDVLEQPSGGYIVNYFTTRDEDTRAFRVMFEMTFKTSR